MKEYTSENLRNVGIVAHGKAGKTSLTEALLYSAGMVTRLGKVVEGSATTDYEPEEIRRKITIGSTMAPCEWLDTKINFIDTPGFVDFLAEVKGAVRAVDSALVVLCATAGVEVETERVWRYADEAKLQEFEKQFNEVYTKVMANENMKNFEIAKADFDQLMKYITGIISMCAYGEDPETCDPNAHQCSGNCSSCGSDCH